MTALFTLPYQTLINSNTESPQLISGGALYFYEAGTTTDLTVYSDADLSVPHSQPVEADSSGRFPPIYLPVGDFKVVLKDDVGGSTIWTADEVPGTPEETAALTAARPITPVVAKVGDYTIKSSDLGSVINCNPTGATFTITLISAVTATDSKRITLRHVGTANYVKVVTSSAQTITRPSTGVTTTAFALTGYGQSVTLVSDGANWHVTEEVGPLIGATTGVIVIEDRITSAPGAPNPGDRYIVTSAYSTFEVGDIIEYTGQTGDYIEYTPPTDCGWIAYVKDEDESYQFQGTAWAQLVTAAALQTDQETATSVLKAVTPGRQQFHPSAAKCWIDATNAGTINANYNISSIGDNGTGTIGINIGTDFSSSAYSCVGATTNSSAAICFFSSKSSGSITLSTSNVTPTLIDVTGSNMACFGDQ